MDERNPVLSGKIQGSTDGLLKGCDAFGYASVVDVHRVDLGETFQRRFRLARRFLSYAQIIPQGERAFRIIAGGLQSALIPDRGDGRLALLHEGQAEERAALHRIAEGPPAFAGLGNFLELADGFLKEAHFTKRDAQAVVCFEILILCAHLTEFGAKLVEHFLERAGLARLRGIGLRLRDGRRLGIGHRSRKSWRKSINAELIDFAGKIRQELIGSKTAPRGWRWRGILPDRLGWSNRRLGRPLVVGRDEGLRLQYEFILLFQFKFGLARLGRFLRSFSGRFFFRFARCRCLCRFFGDGFRLERNCGSVLGDIERGDHRYIVWRNDRGFLANLELFHFPRFRVTLRSGHGLRRHWGRRFNSRFVVARLFENGCPFVGQINFLHVRLRWRGAHSDWLGTRFFHGRGRGGRRFFRNGFRGDFRYQNIRWLWFGGFRGRRSWRRNRTRQFLVRQTSGALEAPAQFPKSFGAALIARFTVDLLQLRGKFGGTPVVACAKDKVEQFFECRRVARCAAQDGLEQPNGFLREAVAGEEVHVGERLRNESLRLIVKRRFAGCDRGLDWYFGSGFFLLDRQLGSGRLRNLCPQLLHGKFLRRSGRQESHFAEHAIELPLCRIALRFAVEELFEGLLCSFPVVIGNQGISQVRQRVGQAEGIAGAPVQFHEPFQRLDTARHGGRKFVQ